MYTSPCYSENHSTTKKEKSKNIENDKKNLILYNKTLLFFFKVCYP